MVIWARRVGFAAGVTWMVLLPAAREIWRVPAWARAWRMYEGQGTDVCQVDYYEVRPSGSVPIDRLAVLSPSSPAPVDTLWLRNKTGVTAQGARLCKVLKASDVRAKARCGTRGRWSYLEETNLCGR